jgi:hypothetical protein
MRQLPKPMIRALELMAEKNIRVDDVSDELKPAFDLCDHDHLAGIATRYGSEPTQPKQILKPVSELQPGDVLKISRDGYQVESISQSPMGIQVQAKGCKLLRYRRNALVDVLDGQIPVRETWREYQINSDGEAALNWHRMGESEVVKPVVPGNHTVSEETLSEPKEWNSVNAAEFFLGEEMGKILKIAESDKSCDDKMRKICGIDRRYIPWKSPRWAKSLNVSEAAIRNTKFWKEDLPKLREADNFMHSESENNLK